MPKNLFQDMVKVNQARRTPRPKTQVVYEEEPEYINPPKGHKKIWLVAFIAVVFFLFALSYFFARAEVSVNPRIKDFNLNQNFAANLNSPEGISFNLVVISGEETENVTATEEKEVAQSAHGLVVIYNNFSTTPQRLDINTRLEGSNGKMYKTVKPVVVPGVNGAVPGSVEVGINGFEVGDEYNSAPLDFKIFGFKGTPKYEKFFARSKDAIVGGFKGLSHVVSTEDKDKSVKSLTEKLKANLWQKATDQIPAGFLLYKDAVYLDIEDGADVNLLSSTGTLPITLKGTLYGALLAEGELSKKIVGYALDKDTTDEVYISNIKDLVFKLVDPAVTLKDTKTINFNLSGSAKIVWKVDTEKLTTDLLSKSKKDFNQVLLTYPNIDSADLSISPVWNRSIPKAPSAMKIQVNYPQ